MAMTTPLSEKEWLSVQDIGRILEISPTRIRNKIYSGYFKRTKFENYRHYVHRDEIVPLINGTGGRHGTRE